VFIVDFLLRRGRYDSAALHAERSGVYWVRDGFRPSAFIALAAGIVISLLMIDTTVYAGPIATALGGADLSIPVGFAVTALTYWALARTAVGAEAGVVVAADAGAPSLAVET
jgi:nucleobase:cation symporter-1, NCS1 family